LYSDRGSHFFVTVKEGKRWINIADEVGRAMKELGVQMIGLFAPGEGKVGAQFWDLARAFTAGTPAGRDHTAEGANAFCGNGTWGV